MSDDIDEARDWQGHEVDCTACAHLALNAAGGCSLRHACVNDRYARRIDRFFNWNPGLADAYLGHPHFEVRAIAAKFANLFLLPPLLGDADETVRWNAVRRLPKRYALQLRKDPHREVRMRVVTLIDGDDLLPMVSDEDYYVRLVVARKLAPLLLGRMIVGAKTTARLRDVIRFLSWRAMTRRRWWQRNSRQLRWCSGRSLTALRRARVCFSRLGPLSLPSMLDSAPASSSES